MAAVTTERKEYKSPLRKLVRFFERSRDRWKDKCQQAKRIVKQLSNRVRAVERSRDHWKGCSKALRARVSQLERQVEQLRCKN